MCGHAVDHRVLPLPAIPHKNRGLTDDPRMPVRVGNRAGHLGLLPHAHLNGGDVEMRLWVEVLQQFDATSAEVLKTNKRV